MAVQLVFFGHGATSILLEIVRDHFAAIAGVPLAALISLMVVGIFGAQFGDIAFKALGVEFHGASGPVVLWILAFLAQVVGIRALW